MINYTGAKSFWITYVAKNAAEKRVLEDLSYIMDMLRLRTNGLERDDTPGQEEHLRLTIEVTNETIGPVRWLYKMLEKRQEW